MRYRRVRIAGATYFFTLVTERRRPLLSEPSAVALFLDAVERIRSRHPFNVDAYVVLPDHLHAVWTLPDGDAKFSTRWRLIKEAFTRAYIKTHEAPHRNESRRSKGEQSIWQRRFWEHVIRDDADFAAHLDYIHLNPVHHGLAAAPRNWPHSSFREWVDRGAYDPTWGSDGLPVLLIGRSGTSRLGRVLHETQHFEAPCDTPMCSRLLGLAEGSTQPTEGVRRH